MAELSGPGSSSPGPPPFGRCSPGRPPRSRACCSGWFRGSCGRARWRLPSRMGLRRLCRSGSRGPSGRDAALLDHVRCAVLLIADWRGSRPSDCTSGRRTADARRERPGSRAAIGKTGCRSWWTTNSTASGCRCTVRRPGAGLHPQPGRHHRPAARGRRHGARPAAADSGAGRRGAVTARGRQPGGVPGGRLADHERRRSRRVGPGRPAAGVLLRPAARRRARSAGHPVTGPVRGHAGTAPARITVPREVCATPRRSQPDSPRPWPGVTRAW